jgi:hypothetical protein
MICDYLICQGNTLIELQECQAATKNIRVVGSLAGLPQSESLLGREVEFHGPDPGRRGER